MAPDHNPCCLVVDSGYAHTHTLPYFGRQVIVPGLQRIDVGGRTLTNYLMVRGVHLHQVAVLDPHCPFARLVHQVCTHVSIAL
jgi:hypothetical protein